MVWTMKLALEMWGGWRIETFVNAELPRGAGDVRYAGKGRKRYDQSIGQSNWISGLSSNQDGASFGEKSICVCRSGMRWGGEAVKLHEAKVRRSSWFHFPSLSTSTAHPWGGPGGTTSNTHPGPSTSSCFCSRVPCQHCLRLSIFSFPPVLHAPVSVQPSRSFKNAKPILSLHCLKDSNECLWDLEWMFKPWPIKEPCPWFCHFFTLWPHCSPLSQGRLAWEPSSCSPASPKTPLFDLGNSCYPCLIDLCITDSFLSLKSHFQCHSSEKFCLPTQSQGATYPFSII